MQCFGTDALHESLCLSGNFIALGTMDCVIEIWDLDVINTMEPAFQLGLPSVGFVPFVVFFSVL